MSKARVTPPFPSYRGEDPFLFICYAHANADEVYKDLMWMRDMGLNIWYDEGISPGRQWRDDVAEAINQCSLFLIFMSKDTVESLYCQKEINFALSTDKKHLVIYLEDTELPPGLSLAIGDIQALLKHEISREDYERKLLEHATSFVQNEVSIGTPLKPPRERASRTIPFRSLIVTSIFIIFAVFLFQYARNIDLQKAEDPIENISFMPRDWILLVVENQTTNEVFGDSLELALSIALRESKYLNLFPKSRMRNTLLSMGRTIPDNIGTQLGFEIAVREDVTALVETSVKQQEGAYVLTARIFDPMSKLTVFTGSVFADAAQEVLPKLEMLANKIRRALGEPETMIQENAVPLMKATTSDLNALRIYSSAISRAFTIPLEETIEQLQQAVKLDPDFALAHAAIANYTWAVDGDKDVAKYHWNTAMALVDRLSQRERLIVSASRAWLETPVDMEEKWRLITRIYPDDPGPHHNLGLIRWNYFNDFEGAIPHLREALRIDKDDPGSLYYLGYCLLGLGRVSEAIEAFDRAAGSSALIAGVADANLVLGEYEKAREPLRGSVSLTPGQSEPLITRLVAIEIDQGEMTLAYDLAKEGLNMSRTSRSNQSIIGFSGAMLAISEKSDKYDFPAHLNETQSIIEGMVREDKLWRYPTRELALTGKMAVRKGLIKEASAILENIRRDADHTGYILGADFEKLLAGEIIAAGGDDEHAVLLFKEIINSTGLYQAHESAAQAYRRQGNTDLEARELAWLVDNKGQAIVEASDTEFGREMNLLDYIDASSKFDTRFDHADSEPSLSNGIPPGTD